LNNSTDRIGRADHGQAHLRRVKGAVHDARSLCGVPLVEDDDPDRAGILGELRLLTERAGTTLDERNRYPSGTR